MGLEILGFIGTFLVLVAYFPQIQHMLKEHCSEGISISAWVIWMVATILVLIYALSTNDLVFKILQIVSLAAIVIILILSVRYHDKTCRSKEVSSLVKKKKKRKKKRA